MINYELAKQLKEAGFPQKTEGQFVMMIDKNGYEGKIQRDVVYTPSLSELIEACGDKFERLMRVTKTIWSVTDTRGFRYDYSTPEEAVAKLWLELNKK